MDDTDKTRLDVLLHRQSRSRRAPALVEAWRERGVPVSALNHEITERLIDALRAKWRQPDQPVADLQHQLQLVIQSDDAVLVLDFWQWDEAVAVLVPTSGLCRTVHRLREIYPDGFLVADQHMSRAALVDFGDHLDAAAIAQVSWE